MDIAPHLDDLGYCPFALATGKPCVLCGGYRALLALVRGDVYQAYRYNISVLLLLSVLCLFAAKRIFVACKSKNLMIVYPGYLANELSDVIRRQYRLVFFVGLLWWVWNIQRW